jgi:D-alanyl-lipoteichoic acid acyltransferase DltB (MBOAT superfamily)
MSDARNQHRKRFWFWLSIGINLGFLGFFKYYNLFHFLLCRRLSLLGLKPSYRAFKIILPVGISFYTFHGLSYVIDIYRTKLNQKGTLWITPYLSVTSLYWCKGGTLMKVRNTFIIFIVRGFWHGANWTFIAWGLLNVLYIMPSILF